MRGTRVSPASAACTAARTRPPATARSIRVGRIRREDEQNSAWTDSRIHADRDDGHDQHHADPVVAGHAYLQPQHSAEAGREFASEPADAESGYFPVRARQTADAEV